MTINKLLLLLALIVPISVLSQQVDRKAITAIWTSSSKAPLQRLEAGEKLVLSWIREDNNYALELAQKVNQFGESQEDVRCQISALNTLGQAYEGVSDHRKAIETYQLSLEKYRSKFDVQFKIDALCGLAKSSSNRGDHNQASISFGEAVRLVDSLGNPEKIADVYVLIAEFYRETLKYDYALNYLNKVRSIVHKGQASPQAEMEMYSRFAAIYQEHHFEEDSIPIMSEKCIELGKKYGDDHVVATALNQLGYYYAPTNPSLSRRHYADAIQIWKRMNYLRYEAHSLMNLYRQHPGAFTLTEVIVNLEDIIARIGDKPWLLKRLELHDMLASRYEMSGDLSKALLNYKKYLKLHAEHSFLTNQQQLNEIQEKYETERNHRTISEQQGQIVQERLEKDAIDSRANRLLWFLVLAVLLLLVVIYSVYRFRKSNQQLKQQKIQIEASNRLLEELLSGRELLLKEIHHRVKNNLQMVVSLLELQAMGVKDEETRDVLRTGNQRVKSMALVHKRLYQGADLGYVEVEGYVSALFSELDSAFIDPGVKVVRQLKAENILLDVDTIIPFGLILTELITNSFKYAKANPLHVVISLEEQTEGTFLLTYQDNGVGMPDTFDIKKARSLGMRMIHRLSQQLNGTLTFRNENGLRIEIQFEGTKQRQKTA